MTDQLQSYQEMNAALEEARAEIAALKAAAASRPGGDSPGLLATLVTELPGALAYADRDLVFQLVNPTWARLFSRTADDFVGRTVFEVFPGTESQVRDLLEGIISSGEAFHAVAFPFRYEDSQGVHTSFWDLTWHPVKDAGGHVLGLLALAFEVTARVALEQTLAKQRDYTDLIIRNAPMAIAFVDETYVTRWVNPAFSELSGRAPEEFIGRTFRELAPESADSLEAVFKQVADTLEPVHGTATPLLMPRAGKPVESFWDFTWVPVIGPDGHFEGVNTLAVECTERVEHARMQTERIAHLQEVVRLKTGFVNAVSHELRTPLTSIIGFSEFLEEGIEGPLNDGQRTFVTQIEHSARRLQHLVNDLLDFAQVEAGTFLLNVRQADLAATLRDEVGSLSPQAMEAGITLVVETPDQAVPAWFDVHRIGQALLNLAGNGLKFTPRGGTVTVSLTATEAWATIRVTDTGVGIDAQCIGRIFERFYQVDPSTTRLHAGAGLGLAITKTIVEAHGGTIQVTSQLGEGTVFDVTLPRTAELSTPSLLA